MQEFEFNAPQWVLNLSNQAWWVYALVGLALFSVIFVVALVFDRSFGPSVVAAVREVGNTIRFYRDLGRDILKWMKLARPLTWARRQVLGRIHDLLCRIPWYAKWHDHPQRSRHHRHIALGAGAAGTTAVGVAAFKYAVAIGLLASLTVGPTTISATSQLWTSDGDWASWSLTNTVVDTGSIQLAATGNGTWSAMAGLPTFSTALVDIEVAADNSIWLAEYDGVVHRYNGSWTSWDVLAGYDTPDAHLTAIAAWSASSAWVASDLGLAREYNGSTWSVQTIMRSDMPAYTPVYAIWGTSASNVWFGADDSIHFYNGSTFAEQQSPASCIGNFADLSGVSPTDVWSVNQAGSLCQGTTHYNGSAWLMVHDGLANDLTSVYAPDASGAWFATGADNNVYFGTTGSSTLGGVTHVLPFYVNNIDGTGVNDVWAVGDVTAGYNVSHFDGASWTNDVTSPTDNLIEVEAVSVTSAFAISGNNVYEYTGTATYEASGTATITYTPSAGQTNDWTAATPTTITPANTSVTLEYSSDGSNWHSDIADVPSSESLYVKATLATTDNTATPQLTAMSVSYDAITTTVAAPNGAEAVFFNETGDTTSITWSSTGTDGVDHVHLQYSTNSGSSWTDITGATTLAANSTSYTWNMPDISSTTVRVKVILENSSNAELDSDTSDADFTLTYDTTAPTITIASPSNTGTYTTTTNSVAVSGTASDNSSLATVTSSVAGAVTGTANWSQTVSLNAGANSITYTATDSADNTATANIVVTYDTSTPADTTAPEPPSNFSVASCTTSECNLQWGASVSSDRGGYLVVARTADFFTNPTNGTNYSLAAQQTGLNASAVSWVNDGSKTSTTLTGLSANTVYYFAIYTFDPSFNYSTVVNTSGTTATTTTTVTKPDAVTNLKSFISSRSIILTYDPPTENRIVDIYRTTDANQRGNKLTSTTNGTYEDTTAQVNVTYYYNVIIRNTSNEAESDPRITNPTTIPYRHNLSVAISPKIVTVKPGENINITANAYDGNGNIINTPLSFIAQNGSGNFNGSVFTAGQAGDYPNGIKVSTQSGDAYGEFSVDVYVENNNIINSIYIDPGTRTVKPGESLKYGAYGINQNGSTYSLESLGYSLNWSATGGSINSGGTYVAGGSQGNYIINVTATKNGDTRLAKAYVTISNETPRLDLISLSTFLRVPTSTAARFYSYGYDQFNNHIPYGFNYITFSNSDPSIGTIDSRGVFHANGEQKCADWVIRADHNYQGASVFTFARVRTEQYSTAETEQLNSATRVGLTNYKWVVKPGAAQQFAGRIYDGWGKNKPHQQLVWSMNNSEAGTITEDGYFVAGTKTGAYSRVLNLSIKNTNTGEVKFYGQYPIVITNEDERIERIKTNPITMTPNSYAYSGAYAYNQFGLNYQGGRFVYRISAVNGGATISNSRLVTSGSATGNFANTIKARQIVEGSAETTTDNQGTITVSPIAPIWHQSWCSVGATSITDDSNDFINGDPIEEGGNDLLLLGTTLELATGAPLAQQEAEAAKSPEKKIVTDPEKIKLESRSGITWLTNPTTQKAIAGLAGLATTLSVIAAIGTLSTIFGFTLSRLLEIINQIIGGLTNSLHIVGYNRKQQQGVGRIINGRNRQPVANAQVTLVNPQNGSVIGTHTTDPSGRYQFLAETGQAYQIRVEHPQFETRQLVVWNNPHQVIKLGLKLEYDPPRLNSRRRWSKAVGLLDASRLALIIFGTVTTILLALADVTLLVTVLVIYYTFAWALEAYVRTKPRPFGVVTDDSTGQPLGSVVIRIMTYSGKLIRTLVTDNQGRFKTLMSPAYYRISYAKAGYETFTESRYIGKSAQLMRVDARLKKIVTNQERPFLNTPFNEGKTETKTISNTIGNI